jgi:hypothetical protein
MKKILLVLILCLPLVSFSQTLKLGSEVTVVHFNAGWNSAADVKWVGDLEECKIKYCDIATDTKAQNKYEIVVVPTIIVFNEGEEIKRFQADISFAMKATLEEVQQAIEEAVEGDF